MPTSYALTGAAPEGICTGPDGNLWVADANGAVWKVTTAGVPTSYALTGAEPLGICTGPDGNLWVADFNGAVWKVTTGGSGSKYALTGASPEGICTGPDGNLWVADYNAAVWKVTTGGSGSKYALTGAVPYAICTGPDGNLWVADGNAAVWKVTTAGVPTSYALTGAAPNGICTGPDGNLWVADYSAAVWKVTTAGVPTSYALTGAAAYSICTTAPVIFDAVALVFGGTLASVGAAVNPNGTATNVTINYGTTTALGSSLGPFSFGSGTSPVSVGKAIPGLSVTTTYYAQVVAVGATTVTGPLLEFATAGMPNNSSGGLGFGPLGGGGLGGQPALPVLTSVIGFCYGATIEVLSVDISAVARPRPSTSTTARRAAMAVSAGRSTCPRHRSPVRTWSSP